MIILPCIPEEVFILVANMITLFTFRFSYLQCCCWYFLCSLHCEFCQPLLSWWFDFFFPLLSSIFYFEDKVTSSDKLCASLEILNSKGTPISCSILSMSIGGSFFDIVLFHEHLIEISADWNEMFCEIHAQCSCLLKYFLWRAVCNCY